MAVAAAVATAALVENAARQPDSRRRPAEKPTAPVSTPEAVIIQLVMPLRRSKNHRYMEQLSTERHTRPLHAPTTLALRT